MSESLSGRAQPPAPDSAPPSAPGRRPRQGRVWKRIRRLIAAIEENDEARIEAAILDLSRTHRILAPLALVVGAFTLLFDGLRLLVRNWRLTLVQALPAMWIWLAMFDLKLHVLKGRSLDVLRGPVLIPIVLTIVAITVVCFFLNAVFAFAIARTGPPEIRPAVAEARRHLIPIVVSGAVMGAALGFATMIVTRWGHPWFGIALSIVVGLMMVAYIAVPARLIGGKPKMSRRDKLSTSLVGGLLGATISTPPYLLGRVGLLMLGSKLLLVPGIVVLAVGITLQAGTTGAVRAIKMSAALTAGRGLEGADPAPSSGRLRDAG